MKTPYRVGLTGGIGSGKSTVAGMFAERGVPIIDADKIAREAVLPGTEAFNQIVSLFGDDVVSGTGELRRNYLREVIFNDSNKRELIERIIHPVVYHMIEQQITQVDYPYCIISIPLLMEKGGGIDIDEIIVVDAPEQLRINRTCRRDTVSEESVKKIISSQFNDKKRLELADEIITNDKDIQCLESRVGELHEKYLNLSEHRN